MSKPEIITQNQQNDIATSYIAITGTMLGYYFVCHRKLWYFYHNIQMEQTSDLVEQGQIIHQNTYKRENKEIQIGPIKIDFIDNEGIIHEIKKSPKMEKAHIWQLKYYLYYLKKIGIENITGELNYPTIRQKETVYLKDTDVSELEEILQKIDEVIQNEIPSPLNKTRCNQCSYYELCYID